MHHVLKHAYVLPIFCVSSPSIIESAAYLIPEIHYQRANPACQGFVDDMFVERVFENMRVGEGIRTCKNIVVEFGDRENAIRLHLDQLMLITRQPCNIPDPTANASHHLERSPLAYPKSLGRYRVYLSSNTT
jgi:hypothetical protein